jgi:hypothetical protein
MTFANMSDERNNTYVVCDCGTMVRFYKYKTHLKTNAHTEHLNTIEDRILCNCGLRYKKWSSCKHRHLHSMAHKNSLDESIKKITPEEFTKCFKIAN